MFKNYSLIISFLFSVLCSSEYFSQQISINEIMSSNTKIIKDENGDFEDWIEIYNYGTTTINLAGYGLSDEVDNPYKWKFPSRNLAPNQYLIVWASDKNRANVSGQLHTNFKLKSGGETIVLTSLSGTKIDESPAVAIPTDKSYGRKPDGTGDWNFFETPTPNASNSTASNVVSEKIAINEFMSSNGKIIADEDGTYQDWIELYNYGQTTVNLTGFGLSDDEELPFKWVFPSVSISPGQFLLIWASGKDRKTANNLHTKFGISATGENIFLTNLSGVLVSGSPSIDLGVDVSYGRQPDGTGSWLYFNTPTPLASNANPGTTTPLYPPSFSHESGLYSSGFDLTLTAQNQGATIIYTLDGSEPDINNLSGKTYQFKNDYPEDFEKGLILYIGTIIRKKGVFELPEIFNKVRGQFPEAKLVLIGGDSGDVTKGNKSTWELVQQQFQNADLEYVSYLGKIPYIEVQDYIKKANVCIFPTYAETLGMVTIESMALQKTVVNSNIGWANELMEDGKSGFLVHPANHDLFAEKIIEVLNDNDFNIEMGNEARIYVEEHFDINKKVEENINYYQSLIK